MSLIQQVDIPEAECGRWRIEKFTVSEKQGDLEMMRAMFGGGGRGTPAGTYTRLMRGGTVVMSDTSDEMRDHLWPVRKATGHCLVNGLGLGMVANAMARKPEVESVTVIELAPEVIELVAGSLLPKVRVINEDAYTWSPPRGQRYGCVWHDIWDDICLDSLPQRTALKRKYGRRADWQGDWAADVLKRARAA